MKNKINKLILTSKEVIKNCALENGAIIAANSDLSIYPKDAQSYRYVWPRDASFVLVAADILKIKDIHENFYNWILDRAEEFSDSGLLYQNYYPNGPKKWQAFQPDQNGTVLWSIYEHFREDTGKALEFKELIEKLANGICSVWNGRHFTILTQDIWEENYSYPKIETNHTYSLAACSYGLECANKIINNEKWLKTASEMKSQIDKAYNGYFFRLSGKLKDKIIDASMLGLVYPFNLYDTNNKKIINTVNKIEEKIVKGNCVYRYENDSYDSFRFSGIDGRRGSGFWPVLNFWMSIHYAIKKDRKKALNYYLSAVDRVNDYIPEQIFDNDIQNSPKPLAWSHAMFIISSKFLGFA
jgi:GH15 family glucan-1,4-alpha-glucosidase